MNIYKTVFFFLIICSPVLGDESEGIIKLRETIKQAFVKVEAIVFKKVDEVKPIVPVKCECNGTGYITHGDGHKTPCPNYPGCTKGTGQVAPQVKPEVKVEVKPAPKVEVKPVPKIVTPKTPILVVPTPKLDEPVKLNAVIKMYSASWCGPCRMWKNLMRDRLVKAGWTIEIDESASKYSRFPTFEVYVNGKMESVTGYMDDSELNRVVSKLSK